MPQQGPPAANSPRLRVLVAVDVQRTAQPLGPAEEDARLARRVQLPDAPEYHVPVGPAKVGRAPQARDGVLVSVDVVDHDVGRVVRLDRCRQIRVDFDAMVHVLRLDGQQQRAEPLKRAKVAADPEKVHLGQARLGLRVVDAVPDGLEDRRKGRHADARAHENRHLVLEHVLGRRPERPVNVDPGQHPPQHRVHAGMVLVHAHDPAGIAAPFAPVAPECLGHAHGKVALAAHVDGNVVLLGRARQGKGMVLPQRHGGAAKEDVLAGARLCVFLLDLDLAHLAGVLDHLGNVRLVAAADLAGDALGQVDEAAVHPVLPKDANGRGANVGAKGGHVGLDHAKGAV
ncbi:hypothetical protein G6O67_001176 [Ophiocordyceps sinensis]|uniref:Uncharacterized protein n=1 Tax=Ophiocordyceps sinensis TaxID=72228 RepID=A0A8H4V8Y4_9HYPO|nr:hypothetical protein G6O67_001176 [Ophiocordyceps sinensis]